MAEGWQGEVGLTGAVLAVAMAVRLAVGLHPYSGMGNPPKFGDYEAQRHWMEVTVNLPAKEWYVQTERNDLGHWGLDYPPMSAYQSYAHGLLVRAFEPAAVELGTSVGYETESSKDLLRATVLVSDLLIMFPAVFLALRAIYPHAGLRRRAWALAVTLLHPGFVLIDHGHFQYNCISLGLVAGAVAAIWRGRDLLGSCLYVLALNHKHMSAYYALAFFAHLLGAALRLPTWRSSATKVSALGAAVVLTFALAWLPFLGDRDLALAVLRRLVPIRRGVFEDYVSNFWCVTHVAIKWKKLLSDQQLAKCCALVTAAACAPSVAHQLLRPSRRGLLLAALNCSLGFYLFSFQVHEKSILLPCLPAALLSLEYPWACLHFAIVSAFSMIPLLQKDGLELACAACVVIFISAASAGGEVLGPRRPGREAAAAALLTAMAALSAVKAFASPPERYPYLFDLLISALAFAHFACYFVYWNVELWARHSGTAATKRD